MDAKLQACAERLARLKEAVAQIRAALDERNAEYIREVRRQRTELKLPPDPVKQPESN